MKNFYLLKLKIKDFNIVNQIKPKSLSWNRMYLLNQNLQYQIYKIYKYQKSFAQPPKTKNVCAAHQKLFKCSIVHELNLIHLVLNELQLDTQEISNPTKYLSLLKILNNKEQIKYYFFYILNKKNNQVKAKRIYLSDSDKIFLAKNLIQRPRLKSDLLIKKLFYKHWFLNSLESYYASKMDFTSIFDKKDQRFDLFGVIKKIFLSLYLEPKFVIMLTIILSKKNIDSFIQKILLNNIEKTMLRKEKLVTHLNIKRIFSKKITKFIYFEYLITNHSLLKNEFYKKSQSKNYAITRQKLNFFTVLNSLSFYEKVSLNLNIKHQIKILKMLYNVLNLKDFLQINVFMPQNFVLYDRIIFFSHSIRISKLHDIHSFLQKNFLKKLKFKQSITVLSLNKFFQYKNRIHNHLKQTCNTDDKNKKQFFILNSMNLLLILSSPLTTLQKQDLEFYKLNFFIKSQIIRKNLTYYKKSEYNCIYRINLTSYSQFLKIFLNIKFLKTSKNNFLVNFFMIDLQKMFLNYFCSKLNYGLYNSISQKTLTQDFYLSFKNFYDTKINIYLLGFFHQKVLNKHCMPRLFNLFEHFFFKSKSVFFIFLTKYNFLNLFFIRFYYKLNKNYFSKTMTYFLINPNWFKKFVFQNYLSMIIFNQFWYLNLMGSYITINSVIFDSFLFKYYQLTHHQLLKLYQIKMKGSLIFYGEYLLICQKSHGFIETHYNSLLQLIYRFNFSIKKTKLVHTLFLLNNKSSGFIFYGFSINQEIKNIKPLLNSKQNYSQFFNFFDKPKNIETQFYLFNNVKLNIVPSKTNLKNHINQIKYIIFKSQGNDQKQLIMKLTPKIYKWLNYYKIVHKKYIFNRLNNLLMRLIWKWCLKRHQNKNTVWIKEKYFFSLNTFKYMFSIKKQIYVDFVLKQNVLKSNILKSNTSKNLKTFFFLKSINPSLPQTFKVYKKIRFSKKKLAQPPKNIFNVLFEQH